MPSTFVSNECSEDEYNKISGNREGEERGLHVQRNGTVAGQAGLHPGARG